MPVTGKTETLGISYQIFMYWGTCVKLMSTVLKFNPLDFVMY